MAIFLRLMSVWLYEYQVAKFIQHLRQKKGVSPKTLEFGILTAYRSGEIFGAKWQEYAQTEA